MEIKTAAELKAWLAAQSVSRKITTVQLHHTYSPSYKDFNGSNHAALQSGMKSYHVKSRGFSDIAQHFTIFPDGKVMTGRSLDRAAAGIIGCNTDGKLWMQKCAEDKNVYWLCYKMANKLRGTL